MFHATTLPPHVCATHRFRCVHKKLSNETYAKRIIKFNANLNSIVRNSISRREALDARRALRSIQGDKILWKFIPSKVKRRRAKRRKFRTKFLIGVARMDNFLSMEVKKLKVEEKQ
jgi:hypothetical protein